MSDQVVRLTVDPARLRRDRTAVIVILTGMIALAVFCVVVIGVQGLWMASLFAIYLGLISLAVVRGFLWGRRFLGKEVRLDDEGLTVTKDGRVEFFITWDDVTSIGGGESILTIRSRRGRLTLIPEVCAESRDFMLALRRQFNERHVATRLTFADLTADAVWAAVWMIAILAGFTVPALFVTQGLNLFEDPAERTHWLRFVANALTGCAALTGVAGGLRFSHTWGSHRIGRGMVFPAIAAIIAVVWAQASFHSWFAATELTWRSLLAGVLAAATAYGSTQAGRYKLWSREHVDRETGAASLPEGEKLTPCRRWVLWTLIGVGVICIVITGTGPFVTAYPILVEGRPHPPGVGAIAGSVIIALLFITFTVAFIWFELQLVGTLCHQAMRFSAQAFEYWDWRARHFSVPWDQVASIEALYRQGVVRVHYGTNGEPAQVDLDGIMAWHNGLATQVLRLFRERAHLTREEPVLRGKSTVGKRYTRGDAVGGA